MQNVLSQIFNLENLDVLSYAILKSTAETTVYKLQTTSENFILKLTLAQSCPELCKKEAFGLSYLKKRSNFIIPNVRSVGEYNS
ncbi:MAG: hypothetical protein HKM28_05695, partial [Flavobacteriaceae bacterium]|nr:hypothetical protein [Flavobacteriaceae bacterium]